MVHGDADFEHGAAEPHRVADELGDHPQKRGRTGYPSPMATLHGVTDLGQVLSATEAASPLEAIDGVARELGRALAAVSVSFLIADLSGRALVRLAHIPALAPGHGRPAAPGERRAEDESATVLPFNGGPEEQAIRTQTVQVVPSAEAGSDGRLSRLWRVLAPVTERGESIGLLELYLPERPDEKVVAEVAQMAHLLAFVVIANRRHTDLFEWGQRTRQFSLSAEIQQRLLPDARTCEASAFTVSGWLEPAASIGGDTFDYSVARDVLHLSLTDAMGHDVNAALLASLCLGALRGARRRGRSLIEQAQETNDALFERGSSRGKFEFVTGVLARVDLTAGAMEVISAGHVAPYLLRRGAVTTLALPVHRPLGLFADTAYRSSSLLLEPGDRIVFVTDGMLERNVASIDLPGAIQDTGKLHPREVVRALADSALNAAGHELQDDATLLCLDWHGPYNGARNSNSGADTRRASAPLPSSPRDDDVPDSR